MLFIFWLQLLLAQIAVVVGCPVAVALRAAALLVEQPVKGNEIQTFIFSLIDKLKNIYSAVKRILL